MAGTLASPGCLDGGTPAVVANLDAGLDLRLSDGRVIRLLGIDPGTTASSAARDRLAQWLVGRAVRVAPLGAGSDRWSRTPALMFANSGVADTPVSVSEALLEAGLVRARPSGSIAPCWPTYLRMEGEARGDRRGVWADAGTGVLAATNGSSLRAHTGEFVVVEGIAESFHEAPARTYLRLSGAPPDDMAVSFDKRTKDRLAKSGIDPIAWLHRRVRIRGFLDDRWGLQIEITAPEQVELIGP